MILFFALSLLQLSKSAQEANDILLECGISTNDITGWNKEIKSTVSLNKNTKYTLSKW